MATINPYESPLTDEEPLSGVDYDTPDQCYRDGDCVVVPRISSLPARCVYCNGPKVRSRKRYRNVWISLFGWTCQFVNFDYCICKRHRREVFVGQVMECAYVVPFILFVVVNYWFDIPIYVFAAAVMTTYVVLGRLNRPAQKKPLVVKKVKRSTVWLIHCGRPFLESLPDLQEKTATQN